MREKKASENRQQRKKGKKTQKPKADGEVHVRTHWHKESKTQSGELFTVLGVGVVDIVVEVVVVFGRRVGVGRVGRGVVVVFIVAADVAAVVAVRR